VTELSASGFWYNAVALRELIERLNAEAPAARHFVVFDACRNTLKLRDAATKALTQPKGFRPVQDVPGGMLVAFATAEGELASDEGSGAGPYARALAEEIVKPGIEAIQVFREAQLRVMESTGQRPWTQNGPMARVYFAGRETPAAPAPIAQPQAPLSEAALAWSKIENLADPAVFDAFRTQYGTTNPLYDTLAAQRLAQLRPAQLAIKPAPPVI
jgi:uncharacterized caspase-like protein